MEWISVDERLPDENTPVIAYIADRDSVIVCIYLDDFLLARVGFDGFSEPSVTHWMPLPPPPEDK